MHWGKNGGFTAGVATLVTKHFHDLGIKVNLFNGSSFSNITNVLVGNIRRSGKSGHKESIGGKVLGWLAKPFIKLGLLLSNWEIDAATAYKSLPDSHKEYMVVRSSKADRKFYGDELLDDPVITHYGSLHMALKDERREQKAKLDEVSHLVKNCNSALNRRDITLAGYKLEDARKHLKERKFNVKVGENGHCVNKNDLKDRYNGRIANEFFSSFFKRSHEHHEKSRVKNETPIANKI